MASVLPKKIAKKTGFHVIIYIYILYFNGVTERKADYISYHKWFPTAKYGGRQKQIWLNREKCVDHTILPLQCAAEQNCAGLLVVDLSCAMIRTV